jgi:hypothetical protein
VKVSLYGSRAVLARLDVLSGMLEPAIRRLQHPDDPCAMGRAEIEQFSVQLRSLMKAMRQDLNLPAERS